MSIVACTDGQGIDQAGGDIVTSERSLGRNIRPMHGGGGLVVLSLALVACGTSSRVDPSPAVGVGGAAGSTATGGSAGMAPGTPADAAAGDVTFDDAIADAKGDLPPTICSAPEGTNGAFSVLTYNVAGLPQGISQSNPIANLQLISPLLNRYDVAVVQENFTFEDYPQRLRSGSNHPYISTQKPAAGGTDMGDGLNDFSRLCFQHQDLVREAWQQCFGVFTNASDCLTSKGFSVIEIHLARGVVVELYDLHMDAGGAPEDIAARASQAVQLVAKIAARSAGKALIVAGDTNMRASEPALDTLLRDAGLTDSCRELMCADERIDRVMYRSSAELTLTPSNWRIATEFVDGSNLALSDHLAVAVDFAWRTR